MFLMAILKEVKYSDLDEASEKASVIDPPQIIWSTSKEANPICVFVCVWPWVDQNDPQCELRTHTEWIIKSEAVNI